MAAGEPPAAPSCPADSGAARPESHTADLEGGPRDGGAPLLQQPQGGHDALADVPAPRRRSSIQDRVKSFGESVRSWAVTSFSFKKQPTLEDFFVEYLGGAELALDLPLDKGNLESNAGVRKGWIRALNWTVEVTQDLADLSRSIASCGVSEKDIGWSGICTLMLYTVWSCIISRMGRSSEFVSGFGVQEASSDFFQAGMVPMIVQTESRAGAPHSASGLFGGIVAELERLRGKRASFGAALNYKDIVKALGLSMGDETSHPIFQTAYVVAPPLTEQKDMWTAMHVVDEVTAPLALQLRVVPPGNQPARGQKMTLQLLFWEEIFSVESAQKLKEQLDVLFSALHGPDLAVPLPEVSAMDQKQRAEMKAWSDKTDYVRFKPGQIHIGYLERASRAPDARALSDCLENGRVDHYSYAEFHLMCSDVCRVLTDEFGVGFDQMVPLLFERGVRMLTAIYAVLMAGGAYVPLEPHYPGARILGILEQVMPPAVLTVVELLDKITPAALGAEEGLSWAVVQLGAVERKGGACSLQVATHAARGAALAPAPPSSAGEAKKQALARQEAGGGLVYVFFTSGSTGKPKGVQVEHAGLRHRVEWMQDRYGMRPGQATILKHAYTFGISEWEMFWPLAVGGALVIPKPGGEKDPEYIFGLCAKFPVSVMYMVPSMLNMLLDYIQGEEKSPVDAGFSLQQVITCGEPLTEETIQQHFQMIPDAELDNLYGPTEGSMTVWRCPRGQKIPQVPIGTPIDGIRVYTLDTIAQRLCEINVPGEVFFAGKFIARGYLGSPEQTAKVFVPDSVMPSKYVGERMYRTGDLACWKPSGQLQFLGRADNQIKLRGFRIEIGEIEAVIRGAAGVKDAVVILTGEGESKFLAAYVAPASVDLDTLRAVCTSRLANYMVPSSFQQLERLPVTDRGKLDKKALPAARLDSQAAAGGGAGGVVPPRNPLEAAIVAAFAEVLKKDPSLIGIESDFVAIGGNSVLAGKVTSKLRRDLKLPLPGTALYKKPTPSQLAMLCAELREAQQPESDSDGQNGDAEGKAMVEPDPGRRWRGFSATRPAAVLMTALLPGVELLKNMSTVLSFVEVLLFKLLAERLGFDLTGWRLLAAVAFMNFVVTPTMIIFDLIAGLLLKHLLIGKLRPGAHPVFSVAYFRWLYSQKIMRSVVKAFQAYFIGTPVLNTVYRCFGAKIGRGVVIDTREVFLEPELITIEDGALIDDEAKITCHSVGDGMLLLDETRVGAGARARPYCSVGRGAHLQPGHELISTSCLVGYGGRRGEGFVTGGRLGKLSLAAGAPPEQQPLLRTAVGVPLLFLIDALAATPTYVLALEIVEWDWVPYMMMLAVVGEHLQRASLVALTVLFKWLLVGRVRPGSKRGASSWSGMCHWVVDTLLERETFKEALEGFINTEVLRLVFVLLGATIGRRASLDMFACRTPDLLTIGDYMLFGSKVGIVCEDETVRKSVQLCRGANVLDNCVLCPGVTVGQGAILGTNTLAAPGQYFPPDTINTGNKGGRAVFLRKKGKGSPESVAMEADANRRLDSPVVWTLFNIGLCFAALMEPAFRAVKTLPLMAAVLIANDWRQALAITFASMLVEEIVEAGLLFTLKWCMIGRFKERSVPFFGIDHYLWMVWLMVSSTFNHLEGFHGTALYSAFLRAMGAHVGRNCTLFGFTLEFDLLHIGDGVSVGLDCDNTCHTVENMVLKMVPVRLGAYSTMQRHSFVMPGAELGEGAVLFEESQVLKGEQVPSNEIWSGNPAEPSRIRRSRLWNVAPPKPAPRRSACAAARPPHVLELGQMPRTSLLEGEQR